MRHAYCLIVFAGLLPLLAADAPAPKSAKEALQAFNDLIGSWRCTGEPIGTREQVQKGFWTETLAIQWQFKGSDAWLKLEFDKGKHFTNGELRYRPDSKDYQLTLQTLKKESLSYTGSLNQGKLIMERRDGDTIHRLFFSLLHPERFLYRYESRPAAKSLFTGHWKVGATKEGVTFATGDGKPECIVSGGAGTLAVTYQGKTYHVCCSGCRSEFLDHPQKYIDEFAAKKAKKAK